MTDHTPTPWAVQHGASYQDGKIVEEEWFIMREDDDVAICSDVIDPMTSLPSKINAEFIVRAVNAHQNLLETLSLSARYLEHPDVQTIPFARSAFSIVELIRSVIAKATEGEQPS